MKTIHRYLLAVMLLCGSLYAHAQSPALAICNTGSALVCNTSTPQGSGVQGDQLWKVGGKYNANFTFLSPLWTIPAGEYVCNPTGSAGAIGYCTGGGGSGGGVTSITCGAGLTGGTITATGTCALSTPVSVANGGTGTATPGIVGGSNIIVTGTWPNQTVTATGGAGSGTVSSGTSGQIACYASTGTTVSGCSGTSYPGLPTDPSAIAATDLLALYSQANSELTTVTPPALALFVGTNALTSGASITPSCAFEDNFGSNTASAGTFTVNAPVGCTAAEGQKLLLHIKFTNAQTYSWNAAFVGGTTALPTTSTGSTKGDWLAFRYDSINSKWDYLAASTGF